MNFWFLLLTLLASSHPAAEATPELRNRQGSFINAPDYQFQNEEGKSVTLDQYFNKQKPVVLSFVYFECPGACTLLLNAEIEALNPHVLIPGRDFELVVVSINPKDTAQLALQKKNTYLKKYGREDTALGWHFLTGSAEMIERLTRRLGFFYDFDATTGQYNHPSAVFFLTPDYVLSGVQSGLKFDSAQFRAAIVDASFRKMGGFIERWNAVCYTFLPHLGPLDRPDRWGLFLVILILGIGTFVLTRFFSKIHQK